MPIGPEITSFGPEPEITPSELLAQQIYEASGVHIMVLADFMAPENDENKYKALVLSQQELGYLQNTDPDSLVSYSHDLKGPNPSFSILGTDVGLPMEWMKGNPMGVSASTEEEAMRLAYLAWLGCAVAPQSSQSPLQ